MKTKILILLLVLTLVACGGISDEEILQTEEAIHLTSAAQSTGTASVEQTSAAATQQHETEVAETASAATETQSVIGTATSDQATRQANAQATLVEGTRVAIAEATEAVSEIYPIVQRLYKEGYISKTKGSFQQFPYFDESWAQIGWYSIDPIFGSEATDFVLLVDVAWESSHKASEIKLSGCGVAFRATDDYSEYYTFLLTLDGNMSFFAKLKNQNPYLSKEYWGKFDYMEDSTTFIITAEGDKYQIFNEDLELIDMRIGAKLGSGGFAYVLSSGGNIGFGTRCVFSDTDLWRLEN
jgi:hypothetical protein